MVTSMIADGDVIATRSHVPAASVATPNVVVLTAA
jgi:hypothetical protein